MRRSTVLALVSTALAVAAPALKPAPKTLSPFGTRVETKGVTCELFRPGELRITVSEDAASASKTHEGVRPNVSRVVDGDFELTARITHTPPKANDLAAVDEGKAIAAAGFALCKPDGTKGSLVVLNRLSKGDEGWDTYFKLSGVYETREMRGVTGNLSGHHSFSNTPIYLRLTRTGDVFTTTQSEDGKVWAPVFDEPCTVPGFGAVTIGPVAVHNTNARYVVTFEEYVLTSSSEKR